MRLIDGDELYQKVVGYNGGAVDKTVAKRLIDQMPTIDAISRQAAVDLVTDMEFMNNTAKGILRDRLRKLPSAQPERKKGQWIAKDLDTFRKYEVVCSECKARYVGNYDAYDEPYDFNYCPNCGSSMKGEA